MYKRFIHICCIYICCYLPHDNYRKVDLCCHYRNHCQNSDFHREPCYSHIHPILVNVEKKLPYQKDLYYICTQNIFLHTGSDNVNVKHDYIWVTFVHTTHISLIYNTYTPRWKLTFFCASYRQIHVQNLINLFQKNI